MPVRLVAVVIVGLVALTGVPRPGWGQAGGSAGFQRLWYQAYDEGVRAVMRAYGSTNNRTALNLAPPKGVDLSAAIANLEAAKRSGPAPGRRVLFQGDRVDTFNPDYYLGLAYYASGRFADAEAAFAAVAKDRLLVDGDPQMRDFQKLSAFATYERLLADGERALRAGRFADVEKMWDLVSAPNGVAASADQDTLDGRAYELRERAKEGAAKLATPAPAPPTNVGIADTSPAPNLPADDPKVAANDPKTPAIEPTKEATPAPPVAVNRPPEQKAPPALANANPGNPPAGVGLDENAITLRGAMAYYEGNYDEAIRILTPAFQSDPPSNVVAFYMACSRAALVASGRANSATLAEAREMYTYARGGAIDRHLRFISPRVRELLGDVPATVR